LITEIDHWEEYQGSFIKTLYFGGGTPSLLSPKQLQLIVDKLKNSFIFDKNIEFTLETNPETYAKEKFIEFKNIGVNRISVGVQSFDDQKLKLLGRIHNSQKAKEAITGISSIFENTSIDLMYGLKDQNPEQVINNLKQAIALKPKHISFYELTPVISERTDLYTKGKEFLEKHGYKQYEISNYALAGFESRHNLAYWSEESYLGLGAAAHSYDKTKNLRWNNTSDLQKYFKKEFIEHKEEAKPIDAILMGLRKNAGMSKSYFKGFENKLEELKNKELLFEHNNTIALTEKGRLVMDQVLLEFL
jgi:oxygen-independent coproporphyrinogen-3 oxidase